MHGLSIAIHSQLKLATSQFQWDSPSSCSTKSKQGKDIIKHKENDTHLHLFVRKFKEIDGVIEPYIYIGKGNVKNYTGEKPITFQLDLHNKVPQALYEEFVTDTVIT